MHRTESPVASFAARFAAKEAVRKACSRALPGVIMEWREIEVSLELGRPEIRLAGKTAALADGAGIAGLEVSLSHSRDHACAMVVAICDARSEPVPAYGSEGIGGANANKNPTSHIPPRTSHKLGGTES